MISNKNRRTVVGIYLSAKPLAKTFVAEPTRLAKPPIVAE
jgi:hypothetical protein